AGGVWETKREDVQEEFVSEASLQLTGEKLLCLFVDSCLVVKLSLKSFPVIMNLSSTQL
ncbi:hypothetical protein XENOCAPTIV_018739, partial [Xenoophorus captivus]